MRITAPVKFFIAMMLISFLIVFSNYLIPNPHPVWDKVEGIVGALFVFLIVKGLNRNGLLNRSFPDVLNVFFLVGGVVLPVFILVSFS